MIAAVNGRVTIDAGPQQQLRRWCSATRLRRQGTAAECGRGVDRTGVATLAEPRRARFQQRRNVGSVRHVAIAAIIRRRWMLPQKWAAFVGVAAEARIVDSVLDE